MKKVGLDMVLKYKYELTKDSQKDYIAFHLFSRKKVHLNPIILTILLIAFSIFSFFMNQITIAIVSLVLIVVVNAFLLVMIKKVYKNNIKEDYPDQMITIEINEEKVILIDDLNEEQKVIPFNELYKIYVKNKYIYIYMNREQAIALINDSLIEGDISAWYKIVSEGIYSKKIRNMGFYES